MVAYMCVQARAVVLLKQARKEYLMADWVGHMCESPEEAAACSMCWEDTVPDGFLPVLEYGSGSAGPVYTEWEPALAA